MISKLQKDVLIKLVNYFDQNKINYVLLGAFAPLILIESKQKNTFYRITNDIDFSLLINSWKQFEILKIELSKFGFQVDFDHIKHRFFYNGVIIDILPYSKNLQKSGIIRFPGTGIEMNVTGFDKLFKYSITENINDNLMIKTIPLPLFVLTKILAYYDRKLKKDIDDIYYVLKYYESADVSERRFDISDIDYDYSGAFLLGKDLCDLLNWKEKILVNNFLRLEDGKYTEIIQRLISPRYENEIQTYEMFLSFKKGFNDK